MKYLIRNNFFIKIFKIIVIIFLLFNKDLLSKEITDFINDHKSWHRILYNVPVLMLIVLGLGGLGWASVSVHYDWSFVKGILGGMVGMMLGVFSVQGIP